MFAVRPVFKGDFAEVRTASAVTAVDVAGDKHEKGIPCVIRNYQGNGEPGADVYMGGRVCALDPEFARRRLAANE